MERINKKNHFLLFHNFRLFFLPIATLVSMIMYFSIRQILAGNFFHPKQIPEFDTKSAMNFLKYMTHINRLAGSKGAQEIIRYFYNGVGHFFNSGKNSNCSVSFRKSHFSESTYIGEMYQFQPSVDAFVIEINPTDEQYQKENGETVPLIFSSHFDGHTVGPSAYDDAINVATMFELISSIKQTGVHRPVYFFFLGSEEWGMHASLGISKELVSNGIKKAYFINLESYGKGRPFAFIQQTPKSYSIIKSWAKSRGSISAPFIDDIYQMGISDSRTDAENYAAQGYSGGLSIFMGNPGVYHTKFDRDPSEEDLTYLGQQLFSFWKNFDEMSLKGEARFDNEVDGIIFGINPFVICFKRSTFKTLCYSIVLIELTIIILRLTKTELFGMNDPELFSSLIKAVLGYFICFITHVFISKLVDKINPLSFSDHQMIFFLIIICICSLILMSFHLDKRFQSSNQAWMLFRMIVHTSLLFISLKFNISAYFFICVIIETVQFSLYNVAKTELANLVLNAGFSFLSVIPSSFVFGTIHSTLFGITTNATKTLSPLVFIACSIFALEIVSSLLTCSFGFPHKVETQEPPKENIEEEKKNTTQKVQGKFSKAKKQTQKQKTVIPINKPSINETKDNKTNLVLIITIIITLIYTIFLLFKNHPFSSEFPIKGSFIQVFSKDEKLGSTAIFMPNFQSPIHPRIKKAIVDAIYPNRNIFYFENYTGPLQTGDALIQAIKEPLPSFINEWPNFSTSVKVIDASTNLREVKISAPNISSEINQVLLVFKCPHGKKTCVKALSNSPDKEIIHSNGRVVVRVLPVPQYFKFKAQVEGDEMDLDILFNSAKLSNGLEFFKYSLKEYVTGFAKSKAVSDTVLKNSIKI